MTPTPGVWQHTLNSLNVSYFKNYFVATNIIIYVELSDRRPAILIFCCYSVRNPQNYSWRDSDLNLDVPPVVHDSYSLSPVVTLSIWPCSHLTQLRSVSVNRCIISVFSHDLVAPHRWHAWTQCCTQTLVVRRAFFTKFQAEWGSTL